MARFDVYANHGGEGFLLDVQADLMGPAATLNGHSDAIFSAIDFLHHGW